MSRSQAPAAVVNLRAALVSYLKGSTLPGCDHDGEALVVDKGYRRWIAWPTANRRPLRSALVG